MVYRLSGTFPKHELFGLTSQFRRAAVSIPSNIAEGFRRRGTADKARFYNIAQSSAEECRYYLILTRDLEYADVQEASRLIQEVSKLLEAYVNSILNSES
jgi:four helix bundle protein